MFTPLGFFAPHQGGVTPMPVIANPIYGLDFQTPLSDLTINGTLGGGTYDTQNVGRITDQVAGVDWNMTGGNGNLSSAALGVPAKAAYWDQSGAGSAPYIFTDNTGTDGIAKWESGPFTIFAVVRFSVLPTGTTKARICSCTTWDATFVGTSIWCDSTGFYFQRDGAAAGTPLKVAVPPSYSNPTDFIIVATWGGWGQPMTLTVNGTTASQTATGLAEAGQTWQITNWFAGGYSEGAQDVCVGFLGEGRVWGSAATPAQVSQLQAYASAKWNTV